ncbi:hypothetical protein VT03_06010 [Planctomyces sp. SH-PL14]|nr:hypothetical protein VT03_06010 [Planctomyces sp. SH-PL14]
MPHCGVWAGLRIEFGGVHDLEQVTGIESAVRPAVALRSGGGGELRRLPAHPVGDLREGTRPNGRTDLPCPGDSRWPSPTSEVEGLRMLVGSRTRRTFPDGRETCEARLFIEPPSAGEEAGASDPASLEHRKLSALGARHGVQRRCPAPARPQRRDKPGGGAASGGEPVTAREDVHSRSEGQTHGLQCRLIPLRGQQVMTSLLANLLGDRRLTPYRVGRHRTTCDRQQFEVAAISLDFSSQATGPSVRPLSLAQAVTRCSAWPDFLAKERLSDLPSIARIVPPVAS